MQLILSQTGWRSSRRQRSKNVLLKSTRYVLKKKKGTVSSRENANFELRKSQQEKMRNVYYHDILRLYLILHSVARVPDCPGNMFRQHELSTSGQKQPLSARRGTFSWVAFSKRLAGCRYQRLLPKTSRGEAHCISWAGEMCAVVSPLWVHPFDAWPCVFLFRDVIPSISLFPVKLKTAALCISVLLSREAQVRAAPVAGAFRNLWPVMNIVIRQL